MSATVLRAAKSRPLNTVSGYRLAFLRGLVAIVVLVLLASAVSAQSNSELVRFIGNMATQEAFPGADQLGEIVGEPPVAEAFEGGELIGYVFLNSDFANSTGYSGKPIHQLIAIDTAAVIRQVVLVEHHEPIVLIGIRESRITRVLDNYVGLDIGAMARKEDTDHKVDIVTGATVTIMVMDDTIIRSAIKVARRFGLAVDCKPKREQSGPKATVNMALSDQAVRLGRLTR